MITVFQIKLLAGIAGFALTGGLLYGGYKYVENQGYQKAQVECQAKFDEYQKKVDERLNNLQGSISGMAEELITQNQSMASDIVIIARNTRNKGPTTIVKEGKCIPSSTFVEGLNEAIDRANKR